MARYLWPQFYVGSILREAFASPSLPNSRIEYARFKHPQKGSSASSKMVSSSFHEIALHCCLNSFNLEYLSGAAHAAMYLWMSEDSILSSHLSVGAGDRTQVAGLAWPTPLPTESSHWLYGYSTTQLSRLLRHFITQALFNQCLYF